MTYDLRQRIFWALVTRRIRMAVSFSASRRGFFLIVVARKVGRLNIISS